MGAETSQMYPTQIPDKITPRKGVLPTRVSMEVIVTIVSKLGYFTYVSGTYPSPTFIGVK